MQYKFSQNQDFQDLASGRVLYHQPGMTNYPVRLAQELFCRSLAYLERKNSLILFDCCCGGGYLLTIIGLLNQGRIRKIYASDIDPSAARLAEKNLKLLNSQYMEQRIVEIERLAAQFGKLSHQEALASARRLKNLLRSPFIDSQVLTSNVFEHVQLPETPDIIMTDVPYGLMTTWQGDQADFIRALLQALLPLSGPGTVIAISMDKGQKGRHEQYVRLEKQLIGKRRFEIFRQIG